MTVAEWLVEAMIKLRDASVDSPRRDALVLLEDTIKKDRAWATTHPEFELDDETLIAINKLIARRIKREPLAYIRGKAWFYGRFFEVNHNVLIPRPESENFIELLKELRSPKIIDIGTGSGALAITTALEFPKTEVIATDISAPALSMAQKNAQLHYVDVTLMTGSLLEPVRNTISKDSVIIANLPYVPDGMVTSPEITQEPREALFSGYDGLEHYRMFWRQIDNLETKPRHVLVESLESQHEDMRLLAKQSNFTLTKTSLLVQLFSYSN